MRKRRRHFHQRMEESIEPSNHSGDSLPSPPVPPNSPEGMHSASPVSHVHHRSEAIHGGRGFFHEVQVDNRGIVQNTSVRVRVEPAQQDQDSVTGCFKAMFKCFK